MNPLILELVFRYLSSKQRAAICSVSKQWRDTSIAISCENWVFRKYHNVGCTKCIRRRNNPRTRRPYAKCDCLRESHFAYALMAGDYHLVVRLKWRELLSLRYVHGCVGGGACADVTNDMRERGIVRTCGFSSVNAERHPHHEKHFPKNKHRADIDVINLAYNTRTYIYQHRSQHGYKYTNTTTDFEHYCIHAGNMHNIKHHLGYYIPIPIPVPVLRLTFYVNKLLSVLVVILLIYANAYFWLIYEGASFEITYTI